MPSMTAEKSLDIFFSSQLDISDELLPTSDMETCPMGAELYSGAITPYT